MTIFISRPIKQRILCFGAEYDGLKKIKIRSIETHTHMIQIYTINLDSFNILIINFEFLE
jgi:hypothetical protein